MTPLTMLAGALGAGLVALTAGAAGACALRTVGELNVELSRRAPIVDGEINGVKVKIMIDTGSATSTIAGPAASALGLTAGNTPGGYFAGGGDLLEAVPRSLKIGTFTSTDLPPFPVGASIPGEPDVAMVVGADFLSQFDVEFDLADNMIRLFHADGCAPPQLVYWNKPYSQAAIAPRSQFETEVALNGRRILAMLDTGAPTSLIDAGTAAGVGQANSAPGRAWNADFASLAIGDESIAHPRIGVADFSTTGADTAIGRHDSSPSMLIGEDFLHAHRVMVDQKSHVMVFSYTGGPIFAAPAATQP